MAIDLSSFQKQMDRSIKNVPETEMGINFVEFLPKDIAFTIFTCLDDQCDLMSASAVSHLWRNFVLSNGLYRNLCLRKAPELNSISVVTDGSDLAKENVEKMYCFILQALSMSVVSPRECMKYVLCSSTTKYYPEQSVGHIFMPDESYQWGLSYWSSKGSNDPDSAESVLLQLSSNFCIINEIDIQPFAAHLERGSPVYSSRFVRFRMGHPRLSEDVIVDPYNLQGQDLDEEKYVWTYTSKEFPLTQENILQRFKLEEPVICVGGILRIDLMGRVEQNEQDELYYSGITHVKVLGHSLSPALEVDIQPTGSFALTFHRDDFCSLLKKNSQNFREDREFRSKLNSLRIVQVRKLYRLALPPVFFEVFFRYEFED